MLKALFILKIFKCSAWLFVHVKEKQLDKKGKVNFKIYDVTGWQINNYKTHIAQYSRRKGNQPIKFGQLIEYKVKDIFSQKSSRKQGSETCSRPLFVF